MRQLLATAVLAAAIFAPSNATAQIKTLPGESVTVSATVEAINGALKQAAEGKMKGLLDFCDEPLVSSDFRGNSASSIVDGLSTVVLEGRMAKVLSWYDNEWGYSCRVADLAMMIVEKGL